MPRRPGRVAVAALLAMTAAGCTAPGAGSTPRPDATVAASPTRADLAAPSTFRASLEHVETKRSDDLLDWRTDWVLHWQPVPEAAGYLIRYSTSEGWGGRERRVTATELKVDVAAGTSPADRIVVDREAQLTMTASQLLVSVAATSSSGGVGPGSGWYRVGEVPPDGIPIANAAPPEHG